MPPSVCLNMIVKNEAHVIERCLNSIRGLFDYWVIVDTGSTDGTPDVIVRTLAEIPGVIHHRQWKDFGTNRTEALQLARGKADYVLVIDADEEMHVPQDFRWPALERDAYDLLHSQGTNNFFSFWRTSLMRDSRNWRYLGVLHEFAQCDGECRSARIEGPWVEGHFDGGRSQIDVRRKYAADARVLERGLEDEPDNPRYVFYLAQSYRDSDQLDRAMTTYQRRAAMGGWAEEVWYSLLQVALLAERQSLDEAKVVNRYLRAHDYRPIRAEALGNLARYMRERQRYASAKIFAAAALEIPRPDDSLFLDRDYYTWRPLDELSVADYWLGNYQDSALACRKLLDSPTVPDEHKKRITENLDFALGKLKPDDTSAAATELGDRVNAASG
jgi:glycosyltransferase involved in cell wall biosynthesis